MATLAAIKGIQKKKNSQYVGLLSDGFDNENNLFSGHIFAVQVSVKKFVTEIANV